jgi:hypothetical protein
MNIIGWPKMTAVAKRVPGSIGFDGLAGRTNNFEVSAEDYDVGISIGGLPAPSTSYYTNIHHPSTKGCVTGILIGERSNGWTIHHPQVSGGDFSRTGIHMKAINGVIIGGYVEAFEDNVNSRGLLFDGAQAITVIGTAVEAATTVANFAIGMINNASDINFINTRPGAGWNSAGKTLTNNGTGVFSWSGLNPFTKQMINLLSVRQFVGDETQGMYKASNDQAGTSVAARTRYFKVGSNIGTGQTLGAMECEHEDVTDPGVTGRVSFVTESGSDGSTGVVFSTGNATLFTERWRIDSAGGFNPILDATYDIGTASKRVKEIFASVGTINTSDRNEKDLIVAIEAAETRVAVKIKAGLKKFKFKDAIALKGGDARFHFGVIAQEVFDCFASEGLNAENYACYCSDTWWDATLNVVLKEVLTEPEEVDKNGKVTQEAKFEKTYGDKVFTFTEESKIPDDAKDIKKHTRLGVRPDQLLYFMMSAL